MTYFHGLGETPNPCVAEQGLTVGEGALARFPCGPNAGELAQRYSSRDAVPALYRLTAVQCGQCWYARPTNPLVTIQDEGSQLVDTVEGGAASAVNYTSDKILELAKSGAGLVVLGVLGFAAVKGLFSGKR